MSAFARSSASASCSHDSGCRSFLGAPRAAKASGVHPSLLGVLGSHPNSSSASTEATLPSRAAVSTSDRPL
eukprot:scaffold6851_cov57-Phaeocystis_antarctica.AAC.3